MFEYHILGQGKKGGKSKGKRQNIGHMLGLMKLMH